MRPRRKGWASRRDRAAVLFVLATLLTAATWSTRARASTLDSSGHLVFDSDAVLTQGFESLASAQAQGASWVALTSEQLFETTPISATSWSSTAGVSGAASLPAALEGRHALKVTSGAEVALALADASLFQTLASERVQVSFWGLSMGAEPELEVVYSVPASAGAVGPIGFARVLAVRTGRETTDGWAEYSTGPVDGQVLGVAPIAAITLSARFSTDGGTFPLYEIGSDPSSGADPVQDPGAYALIDAVEVEPVPGSPMNATACTQATAATACGALGECTYGRCVDGSVVWGAVPQAPDHRSDLVARWNFVAAYLGGDRKATAGAASVFSAANVAAIEGATTPGAFFGELNTRVNLLRDGHTSLGLASSDVTAFSVGLEPTGSYSALLDMCLGLAKNDLPGGTGSAAYAVFWIATNSSVAGTLAPGDMLTQVDGLDPDAWLDAVGPRFRLTLPNDPASEPAGRALLLAGALAQYATTAVFTSCTAAGACTTKTVRVGDIAYAMITGSGNPNASAYSRPCSGRFTDSVSTWDPTNDATDDIPMVETAGAITSVEFDGFEGAYDPSNPTDPYHAWMDPMTEALTSGENVLFDARLGHGGDYPLGSYLVHQIRGTSSPYYAFAVPRGTWDVADPAWIFDPSLAACADEDSWTPDVCGWMGGCIDEAGSAAPLAATGTKIAWLDAVDLSMNDIVPRDLLGAPGVRVFGPHPTTGAYGEISELPPIVGGWSPGTIQVLDTRFGASFGDATAASWASGTGVPPDQVVLQNVSDILSGSDTVLAAATAWLDQ